MEYAINTYQKRNDGYLCFFLLHVYASVEKTYPIVNDCEHRCWPTRNKTQEITMSIYQIKDDR